MLRHPSAAIRLWRKLFAAAANNFTPHAIHTLQNSLQTCCPKYGSPVTAQLLLKGMTVPCPACHAACSHKPSGLYSRIKVVSELVNASGGLGLVTQVVVASKTGRRCHLQGAQPQCLIDIRPVVPPGILA